MRHAKTPTIEIASPEDLSRWRDWLRWLLAEGVEPSAVRWIETDGQQAALFAGEALSSPPSDAPAVPLPRRFAELAQTLAWHRGVEKWALLYRLAWRVTHENRSLMHIPTDEDVIRAERMVKAVRRDVHKMHAFVRFREVADAAARDGRRFVAFHKPDHPIVKREARWFANRFADMDWAILTPDGSASWDGSSITFGPRASADALPAADDAEQLWLTYYANIFNPGRVNRRAMLKEMPKKYWANMPETRLIDDLIASAETLPQTREPDHLAKHAAGLSLPQLRETARNCDACDLCERATQQVFGQGPPDAPLVIVGEQPGDHEDRLGKPFVGPAGQLFDELLDEVGLQRDAIYLTNAVKAFRYMQKGSGRVHRKARVIEQKACRPWLEAELRCIAPRVIVCLGATAAQNVIDRGYRLKDRLGQIAASAWTPHTIATYHPASILRAHTRDPQQATQQRQQLLSDLRQASEMLERTQRS